LWRRKSLRIGLGPKSLIVSGSKPIALAPVEGAPEWRPAVDALAEVLKNRKQDVSVVLPDSFVRYALLPWNAAIKTEEQWMALARHRLAAVHGSKVAEWELRITDTGPEAPRLVCALERALLQAVDEKFHAAGVPLVSVQPFLVAAFNRLRSTIGNGSCWLVVEEPGRLTLALIQRGVWTAIRTRRVDERWRIVLPEILERESAFLALEEGCTRVVVCAQGAFNAEAYEAWHAQALSYPELALAAE
jgi:hypothetical protein